MMIITIDGPAGSGKSTAARLVAKKLGFLYLDTGAIYRTLGLLAVRKGVDPENEEKVLELIPEMRIEFVWDGERQRILLSGEDITEKIRTEEIGLAASAVSKHSRVRKALLDLQRSFAEKGNLVAEGRDTGTVVFPEAEVKIFLTARPEVRAERRLRELREKGIRARFEEILEAIIKRDEQDAKRSVAPLKPAEDAVIIDTSEMKIEEVVERIVEIARQRWRKAKEHTSS